MKRIFFGLAAFLLLIASGALSQQNASAKNPYEQQARTALERIVQEQIDKIEQKANSTKSADEKNMRGYVLSTHICTFSDIPQSIDQDIKMIREQIRLLIRQVATDIEISGGNSGTLSVDQHGRIKYISNPSLPRALNEKKEQLLKANLNNSVSVRSAAMAIRLLAGVNEGLKEQARQATTRQEKERAYMKQAVYVYEMADITLELLSGLTLEGKQTIDDLHNDAVRRVQERVADIDQQINKARGLQEQGLLSSDQVAREIKTYMLMRNANEQSLDAWNELIDTVGKQQDFLNNLQKKKGLIEYRRDKARVQLETLRDLRQVAELKDAIGSLDDLVASVADLDLLVLDENTVRQLLGYDDTVQYQQQRLN